MDSLLLQVCCLNNGVIEVVHCHPTRDLVSFINTEWVDDEVAMVICRNRANREVRQKFVRISNFVAVEYGRRRHWRCNLACPDSERIIYHAENRGVIEQLDGQADRACYSRAQRRWWNIQLPRVGRTYCVQGERHIVADIGITIFARHRVKPRPAQYTSGRRDRKRKIIVVEVEDSW